MLADQKDPDDDSKNSGEEEFSEETERKKFLIHLEPTQNLSNEANENGKSNETKWKDDVDPTQKEMASKEPDQKETRNKEEADKTTQCIDEEKKKARRILDKEVQEIQEIHLFAPNVHRNNSIEEYDFEMHATQRQSRTNSTIDALEWKLNGKKRGLTWRRN